MIDGPNGVLMGMPRPMPNDSTPPAAPAPTPAPSAQEVSAAYQVITQSLKGKTLDAQNLAAAAAEARRYAQLREQAIAEAELEVIAQYNAQHRETGPVPKESASARAARQLKGGAVFDANTLDAAQRALESGDLRIDPHQTVESFNPAVCTPGEAKPLPVVLKNPQTAPSLAEATNRLNAYLASGMSLQEAIGVLRVENGANPAAEDVLARAALASQAPEHVTDYVEHPEGPDPVGLASAKLDKLKLFDASTLTRATQAMTIALPDVKLDAHAAQAAADALRHEKPGAAQFAADMAAYRSALLVEIQRAAGREGAAWLNDTASIDAWLKAEVAVASENLAPLSNAAQGKPDDSPEKTALADAEHLLNLALQETRVIADVDAATPAGQEASASSEQRPRNDLAQSQRLTSDLSALGLVTFDHDTQRWVAAKSGANPDAATMLDDILGDASIRALKQHDIEDVMQQTGSAHAESSDQAKQDLRATSNALAAFKQGGETVFYGEMLDAVQGCASMKQRFDDIASSVHGKSAVDYVDDVAQVMQDVALPGDADLTRALYQQKFRTRFEAFVANGNWRAPSGLSSLWESMDAPKYYIDTSNVYASLGDGMQAASQTAQGAALMNIVKTRMDGSHFVGQTYEGSLTKNGPDEQIKSYYLNWKDKHGHWNGDAQLFQDIAQQDPHSNTARFIEAELPITVDAQTAPGAPAPAPAYEPPDSTITPSGTEVITSRTQLINVLGAAYNVKPMAQTSPDGLRYDGSAKVFGNTTLNDLARATLASQGVNEPSVTMPLELTLLPINFWRQDQDPRKDDPQQLKLVQVNGAAGRRFVGPAGGQSFASYDDWTRHNGFGAGLMLSTQHLLQTATGQSQVWDQTLTGQKKLSNGEILMQAGEAMAGMGAMAVVSFVGPEAEGILLPLLYDGAQTYFAVTGIKGVWDAGNAIAQDPTSVSAWTEGGWIAAANSFTALSIASHFGMTRLPLMLERAFEAGGAAQSDAKAISLPTRLLVSAADNAAGAKSYMALAGAPDAVLSAQRTVLKGAALTNGVLFATQGAQLGAAWTNGQAVSPAAVMQFLATIGMGQFGRLYHMEYATSAPTITSTVAVADRSSPSGRQKEAAGERTDTSNGKRNGDADIAAPAELISLENERLVHVEPSADGRSATLTLASGATVRARRLGASGLPMPHDPAELLLPGREDRAPLLELMRHEETGEWFIVPRIRGGAGDEASDPSGSSTPSEPNADPNRPHPAPHWPIGHDMFLDMPGMDAMSRRMRARDTTTGAWADANPNEPMAAPFSEPLEGVPHLVVSNPQHHPLLTTFDAYHAKPNEFVVAIAVRAGQLLDGVGRPMSARELGFRIVTSARFKGKWQVTLLADGDASTVAPELAGVLRKLRIPVLAHEGPLPSGGTAATGQDGWRLYTSEAAVAGGDAILDLGNWKVAIQLEGSGKVATVRRDPNLGSVLDKEQRMLSSLGMQGVPVLETQRGVYLGRPALIASRYVASSKEVGRMTINEPRDAVTARAIATVLRERGVPLDTGLLDSIRRIRGVLLARRVRITDFDVFFGRVDEGGRVDSSAVVADPAYWESGAPFEHDLRSLDWLAKIIDTAASTEPAKRSALRQAAPVEASDWQEVLPGEDGRSVTLTSGKGRAVRATVLGGRGGLPASRADILMPGDTPRGQRFQAIVDPEDGSWVILRRMRGGAVDEDPELVEGASTGAVDWERMPVLPADMVLVARAASPSVKAAFRAYQADERYYRVSARGTEDGLHVVDLNGRRINAFELANRIRDRQALQSRTSEDGGNIRWRELRRRVARSKQPVVLMADYAGRGLAQRVANLLGVDVVAPEGEVPVVEGRIDVARAGLKRFSPEPRRALRIIGIHDGQNGELIVVSPDGVRQIVRVEDIMGEPLGEGVEKWAFALDSHHVALVKRPESDFQNRESYLKHGLPEESPLAEGFRDEDEMLDELEDLGIPAVDRRGDLVVYGRPARLDKRYVVSTDELLSDESTHRFLNSATASDLEHIAQVMRDEGVVIRDFQGYVDEDGHFFVADPLVIDYTEPHPVDLRQVTDYAEMARRAVAARARAQDAVEGTATDGAGSATETSTEAAASTMPGGVPVSVRLARLTRPKAKPGERDQLLVSGLPVVEDPAAVLYVPRRANAATAASPPRGVAAAEPIGAPASDAVHREPIARSPERTGPFETGFPAKEADYPLSPWMATYVPETGLIYTEARQLDVQWVFRPNYDRRNATKVVMIAPGIHVISAFGVKDAVFDLQGRPVTAIMDLRRRLLSPQRLANRLSENIGLDERSYTPGQPIALLAEHTAAGGRDSFAQRLANEMHVPVYGLQGSYDERQWLLCFPDAVSHPVWQPDTTASRLRLPGGGQPMRVKWTLLELRTSSDLEVWAADDPVKLDRFLAPQGMFVINGHTNELVGRGASSVAASARAAGHVPGKPVLLMTTRADIAGEPFTGELADELQSPILIMTDPAWGPGGKAVRKNTVTVSRVEGAQNRRITIDENGSVTFNDTEKNKGSLVWLNFGPMERSLDYFERKRGAMDDVVIHTFDVPRTLLDTFRRNAVDQLPGNEGKLLLGDWRQVPDQFGLPWDDALRLVGQIIPGSAKTVVVPPRKSGSGDGSVGARPAANASGATVQPIPTASKKLEPQIHPRPDEFGEPVTINAPTEPTDESSWRDPARIAVFVPDGAYPESLNGIPMRPWDPPTTVEGWQSVAGQKEDLVEPERTERVRKAGVVIAEPDGRYWIIETTNHFADGARTFPKGGADAGLSLQATAIKEAYEETGLHVQIDAFLVDVNSRKTKSKVKTRYYLAHRIGGTPAAMGWEAQGVYLVPRALMGETVRTSRDKQIWWEVSRRENDAKLGPGEAAASD